MIDAINLFILIVLFGFNVMNNTIQRARIIELEQELYRMHMSDRERRLE